MSEIAEAGHFNKAHGIKGEISATLDIDIDLNDVRCLVVSVDGIFVPFFITSCRPKTADTCLIMIDGIDSEEKAQYFNNKTFYILRSDIPDDEEGDIENDTDGMYASDLIGYTIVDTRLGKIGVISQVNEQTQNVLFIIETEDGKEIFIPVADEFIENIDCDNEIVTVDLPDGLIDLNT